MNYADEIKRAVSMRDVCGLYGVEVNRGGFAKCIWHSDHKPSMKVYDGNRGCHCFSCGEGGSVIDFTMQYFGLSFKDAMLKLNADFHLCLPIGETLSSDEMHKAEAAKRRAEADRRAREREKVEREYHNSLDRYIALDRIIRENKPTSPDDIPEDYAYAVREIDKAKYSLDEAETRLYTMEHRGVDAIE